MFLFGLNNEPVKNEDTVVEYEKKRFGEIAINDVFLYGKELLIKNRVYGAHSNRSSNIYYYIFNKNDLVKAIKKTNPNEVVCDKKPKDDWYAPAGLNRGKLDIKKEVDLTEKVSKSLSDGKYDLFDDFNSGFLEPPKKDPIKLQIKLKCLATETAKRASAKIVIKEGDELLSVLNDSASYDKDGKIQTSTFDLGIIELPNGQILNNNKIYVSGNSIFLYLDGRVAGSRNHSLLIGENLSINVVIPWESK